MADTEKAATQTSTERGQHNPNHRGRRNYRNKRPGKCLKKLRYKYSKMRYYTAKILKTIELEF
jgi:hypothetical protein